jgi:hypothetical protein
LRRYINSASDFLARECGRVFEREDGIVELSRGYGSTSLRLRHAPIISIESIANDAGDITDYTIEDAGTGFLFRRAGWIFSGLASGYAERPSIGSESPNLTITYTGGFITPKQVDDKTFLDDADPPVSLPRTLPSDLEDACIQLVVSRYRTRGKDVRERSRAYEASGVTFGGEPIPPEIESLINHYRLLANA